ncbi:TPA: hypothetical protein R7376_004690 [Pseudomonas aeruginosa]|nr:Uncharacterised protein [Klebsiella pneumoniae]HEE6746549.1 hypothetical protein [Pseudomonas aeruginosa]HEE6758688.1 hypothetical protein [Pseudomonas aeruginosa]
MDDPLAGNRQQAVVAFLASRLADFQAQARMAVLVEVEVHVAVQAVAARLFAGVDEKRFRHLFHERNEIVLESHFVTVFHGEFHLF